MRLLIAVCALVVFALPAAAEPPNVWEHRSTLRTDLSPGPGPVSQPGEIAYLLASSTTHGVVAAGVSNWTRSSSAYPSADFSLVQLGNLTAFAMGDDGRNTEVSGSGRYYLDLEIRSADNRVGMVTFTGPFTTGWSNGYGYVIPDDLPTFGTLWLDGMLYRIRLGYGLGGPYYQQSESGTWEQVWFATDPVPIRNGGYWTENTGAFYAEITPTLTPEPSSCALAGIGLTGFLLVRRARRVGMPVG